jgi:origin recognition complex subunit 3
MHHFYGNALSIFLPLLKQDELEMKTILQQWMLDKLINEHHITHIRMLGSFRNYVESLVESDPKKALRLLEDDDFLVTETIPGLLCDIKIYQKQFKIGYNFLVLLQAQFPSFSSLHKSRLMLLLEVLEVRDGLAENTDIVRKLVSFVRKIDTDHVGKLLEAMRQLFSSSDYEDVNKSFLDQISKWDTRYEQLLEADDKYNARMDKKAKLLEGMVLEDEGSRNTETARKVQNQSIEHIKRKGTEATKIAMDIADWCEKTLG